MGRHIFIVDLFLDYVIVEDSVAAEMLFLVDVATQFSAYSRLLEFIGISLPCKRSEFGGSQVECPFAEENSLVQFLRDHFFLVYFVEESVIGVNVTGTEVIHFGRRTLSEPIHQV